MFNRLDTDNSDRISIKELRALIFGYGTRGEFRPPSTRTIERWMADFDVIEVDGVLSKEEFVKGMKAWQKGRSQEPEGKFRPKFREQDDQVCWPVMVNIFLVKPDWTNACLLFALCS